MDQNPKKYKIVSYFNDFFYTIKQITLNIVSSLILFDLKFILDNIKDIILYDRKYMLLFLIITPFVFVMVVTMLVIGLINYIFYFFIYIKYNYNVKYNKYNKKILKYNQDKINFISPYNILLKKYILEKPKKIAFYTFYNSLYIIYNLKNKKLDKNYEFLKLIFLLIYNFIIRVLFLIITGFPLIVIKAITYIVIKTKNSEGLNFENINTKIKFILFNCLIDLSSDIEIQIKKMKIIITKKKIIFNSRDFLKNFWIDFFKKVKNISEFKNAAAQLEMNIFLENVKNLKNNKKVYKDLKYKDEFLKENLITTKPHLTLFLKIPNNNNLIYINETSKNELWVWDSNLNIMKKIELFFWHQGNINKKKDTFFTPLILTQEDKILSESSINDMIKESNKLQIIKSGMTANLLLNIDSTLFRTEFTEEENKNVITIKKNDKTVLEEIKEISINNKNNKNLTKILDSFKITEEFIKNNEEIIKEIPQEMRVFFIQLCLNNYYNEKSNLFKEIITKIYFSK